MDIKGCIALVTGANRGLGKSFVDALLAQGAARVYAAARTLPEAASRRAEIPYGIVIPTRRALPSNAAIPG
jgi:NAD(P)-dependent dehydrogenase (short-subunit alcohol dehydrogenase family)